MLSPGKDETDSIIIILFAVLNSWFIYRNWGVLD